VVGHLVREFLPLTETFIGEQLLQLKRFHPVVLAGRVLPDSPHTWPDLVDLEAGVGPRRRAVTDRLSRAKLITPVAARAVRRAIEHYGISCVHAHFGDHAAYYAPAVPRGIPIVTSFYGYDATSFPLRGRGLGARILRRLFRRGDLFLALSEDMRRDLLALGAPPDKVVIHHIGVSLERFSFTARRSESAALRVLFVGRLVEKKGIFDLIAAVAAIAPAHPGLRCDVLGGGALEEAARRAVAAAGLEATVVIHGAVPPDAVADAIAAADLLVAPSKRAPSGDKEGTPTVIQEAMASGLPVVSTRHAGIPEMIESGREGLLVDEGDSAALAQAIASAAESSELRAGWARAARAKIEEGWDATRQAQRLEDLYEWVVARV
jgi:colanic acid/amylovoran biosynthesis glycosyltransferase